VAAVRESSTPVKRILVFGDSLSEGFMLPQRAAWPMLLVDKLRAAGLNYEVTNASQSGGTTTSGLARLAPNLRRKIDIFVLELGVNDAFRGVPLGEVRENLQEILDRVKQANPDVRLVICGLEMPSYSDDEYVNEFARMYVELASKNRAALVPSLLQHVLGNPSLNLADRIHPNAAGHKILAETVWRVLEPVARETANTGHKLQAAPIG
jgi:acyl-CoA thioesterase-1